MSLEFDAQSGKIRYLGREVGEHFLEKGKSKVKLTLDYETEGDWIVPISWLAYGLSLLPENEPPPALLTIETSKDSIAKEFAVVRFLTEKKIKRDGYIWKFHKTDPDDWPSPLHGHDYDKGLKLDALTGDIFDVGTRQRCKSIKDAILEDIRAQLRASKDFKEVVATLIDKSAAKQP